jgi:hypothetical protein
VNGIDQRGFPRNRNGAGGTSSNECDIGAYEFQSAAVAPNLRINIPSPAEHSPFFVILVPPFFVRNACIAAFANRIGVII